MFSFFKSKRKKQMELMGSLFEAAAYRDRMDKILSTYSLAPNETGEDKNRSEIIEVSCFIAKQAAKRSGRDVTKLSEDEMYLSMLIGFVAADHLSNVAAEDFELTTSLTCTMLELDFGVSTGEAGTLTGQVIAGNNRMAGNPQELKVLQATGNLVSRFWATADEHHLNELGRLYQMMASHLE